MGDGRGGGDTAALELDMTTGIEWTDETWNPVRGCTKVSAGCDNCYAMRQAHRTNVPGGAYEGLTRKIGGRPQWNGRIRLVPELLDQPLRWKKPRRIFVNSMSDLFHPDVPDDFIDQVFAVMALASEHTFQVLTKRPERMREYMKEGPRRVDALLCKWADRGGRYWPFAMLQPSLASFDAAAIRAYLRGPLPNVWLGVSVEDQATADERIPPLLDTPAAVRFLSCEPLLGPVDLPRKWLGQGSECHEDGWMVNVDEDGCCVHCGEYAMFYGLDWVIVGGESGPRARPMHPDWARSLRDQCQAAGVPFFFKQHGDWIATTFCTDDQCDHDLLANRYAYISPDGLVNDGTSVNFFGGDEQVMRLGKKRAGRLLDGRTWDEYPEVNDEH